MATGLTDVVGEGYCHEAFFVWIDRDDVVCEVRDAGRMIHPMLGRVRPSIDANRGRGLWLANQLCDLVELRSFPNETVTRLHMRVA
jgi:hypothetical protein